MRKEIMPDCVDTVRKYIYYIRLYKTVCTTVLERRLTSYVEIIIIIIII